MKRVLAGLTIGLSVACLSTAASSDAASDFKKKCAVCHGADGKGQTKMGQKRGVPDFTDAEFQKKYSDEQIEKTIRDGVTRKETGKQVMKPFKDRLSADRIHALVEHVRSFAR
jgi:cytochrome c